MENILSSKYSLSGMDCPGCASTIEQYCKKISGVKNAEVNYSSATLKVEYHSQDTKIKIESGIQKLGYSIKETTSIRNSTQIIKNKFKKIQRVHVSPRIETNNVIQSTEQKESIKKTTLSILILLLFFAGFSLVKFYSLNISYVLFDALSLFCLYPLLKKVIQYFKVGFYFSVEFLMSIAVIGALFIHASQESAMVMILFKIGEALESFTTHKASLGIEKLSSLIPNYANLVLKNNLIKHINASEVLKNQTLLVKPSERFPADGIITEGETYIDESLLTGEATPVHKKLNQKVYAGSLNTESTVKILTTQVGSEHSVARLIQLVKDAQGSKSKTLRSIENFSKYYTPIILILGILTAVLPPLFGYSEWQTSIYKGLAILLIGCPCALIISTPSAIAAGIHAASKLGILIKQASALEIIGHIKTVAFDKTGTLTEGKLNVIDVISFTPQYSQEEVLKIIFSLEQYSTHPLAKSIISYAKNNDAISYNVTDTKTISGVGVSGKINNKNIYICSPHYALENNFISPEQETIIAELQQQGKTVCVLNVENKAIGLIALQDKLKDNVKISIDKLISMKIMPIILTGDHKLSADTISKELNIETLSQLLPEEKLRYIREFSENGKVAMVGDGINDAPALAAADVSVAMGGGTDIAIDSAQIVIANKNVSSIVNAVKISRKTLNLIWQNIAIAILLKLFFLYLVYTGNATLWMAILADTGATVCVTLNSMRLLRL